MIKRTVRPSGWRRALLIAAGVLALGMMLWVGGLFITSTIIGSHTVTAAMDLKDAMDSVKGSDMDRASAQLSAASEALADAQSAADLPPMRALAIVPGAGGLRDDVDNLLGAADNLTAAARSGIPLLARVKGTSGSPPVFENGQFDLKQIPEMAPAVSSMNESLAAAEAQLAALKSIPFAADIRDEALKKLGPVSEGVATLDAVLPELPDALGADGPKQYLVAVLNPAELFPTGGAPLSVMVIRFDKGQMTIPVSGQVSTDIFPVKDLKHLPWIEWAHIAGPPIYATPDARSVFVNSNLHPDFRVSGEEMARAWQAGGKGKIDGVITIDPTTLANILAKTGPVTTPGGGQLNAENLGQQLLIDAYSETQTEASIAARHEQNNSLMAEMTARAQSVQQLPHVMAALMDSGPGRHFQVYLRDPSLQKEIEPLGLAGGLSPNNDDYFSVFTTSSPNKVAVYQDRRIDRSVQLGADGSATVKETIEFRNAAPTGAESSQPQTSTGSGYNDTRAVNQYMVYLPDKAVAPTMLVSGGVPGAKPATPVIYEDVDGRKFFWSASGADPGQTATVEVAYTLPAGTFTTSDGGVEYRGTVDPQPMWQTPSLKLTVAGPPGFEAVNSEGWQPQGSSYVATLPADRPRQFVLLWQPD